MPENRHTENAQDDLRTYTVAEVAQRLQVSERTVARMLDAGELKPSRKRRRGVKVRVTHASLADLLGGR